MEGSDNTVRPTHLLELPTELIIAILRYLDFKRLLRCRLVCKTLRNIIAHSLELQYIIELAADGLIDGPPGPLNTAERCSLLLDRRRRWRTLDWIDVKRVAIPGRCMAYELVGGIFSKTTGESEVVGGDQLVAVTLPTRSQREHSIVHEDMGIYTRDFAIDPSQDLIAYVELEESVNEALMKIYLRTIGTNEAHPLAQRPELQEEGRLELGSSFIQIVDDVLGMFFWSHGPGLLIWNWMTGQTLVRGLGSFLPRLTSDFSFLSNRAFMIMSIEDVGQMEIYTFSGESGLPLPTRVATLLLPSLKRDQAPHHFAAHSGPFVHGPIAGKPFETARDSKVHLLSVDYGERGTRIHIFVKNNFFLSLIRESFGSGDVCVTRLTWDKWGPTNTRCLEHNVRFQWLRYVHGQRVVLPLVFPNGPQSAPMLCVIDFNVHPKRMDDPVESGASGGLDSGFYGVFSDPSTVLAGGTFKEDVVTYLPYAVSSRSGAFESDSFMIDDERIVGVRSASFSRGKSGDTVVYTF